MKKLCESFNEITIKRGDTFQIVLDENPSTGHRWQFQIVAGKAAKMDDQFTPKSKDANVIGGVGVRTMTYKAYGKTDIVIDAQYKRSWEKTSAGALKLKIKIS